LVAVWALPTVSPNGRWVRGSVANSLKFDDHLSVIETSGARLHELALVAGAGAPVATCPDWNVQALMAHQAIVHRWANGIVRGERPGPVPDDVALRARADLADYYVEGYQDLVAALREAPHDLDVMVFLKDPPLPREFWARRQAHETTVHMVDARSATLRRPPDAGDVDIEPALAADGIDELLRGFLTRGRCELYGGRDETFVVVARDVGRRWVLHIGERLTVEEDGAVGNDAMP